MQEGRGGVRQPLEGKTGGWSLLAQQLEAHIGDVNCVRWRPSTSTSSQAGTKKKR
jgi:hypothetical protein